MKIYEAAREGDRLWKADGIPPFGTAGWILLEDFFILILFAIKAREKACSLGKSRLNEYVDGYGYEERVRKTGTENGYGRGPTYTCHVLVLGTRTRKRHVPVSRTRISASAAFDSLATIGYLLFRRSDYKGAVAQLGERVNGIHEVRGSIPLSSTPFHDS